MDFASQHHNTEQFTALTTVKQMSGGEPYKPAEQVLCDARQLAHQLCITYNAMPLDAHERRYATLQQLMPAAKRCQIEPGLQVEYGFNCTIGKGTFINYNATIIDACPVVLGNQVLIGPNTVISTVVGRYTLNEQSASESAQPVTIGHRVWLAANVTICAGVTIGDNAVIGAGSVVTQNVPANALCFGNPARQIRKIEQSTQ